MGVSAERIYELPAVGRVMAYWAVVYKMVEGSAKDNFSGQFASTKYESFCSSPDDEIDDIYKLAGLSPGEPPAGAVHDPKSPYQAGSHRWRELKDALMGAGLELPRAQDGTLTHQDV